MTDTSFPKVTNCRQQPDHINNFPGRNSKQQGDVICFNCHHAHSHEPYGEWEHSTTAAKGK